MNEEAAARRLGALLREGSATSGPQPAEDPERARLLRTVAVLERPDRPRSDRRRWTVVAAAAAVVAAIGVVVMLLAQPRDLTYTVHGAARLEQQSVSAESGEPVQLRFSDGSSFELLPHGRLRIESSTPEGARLLLLDGEAIATVLSGTDAHWSVVAGPFEVVVVGTRFSTHWNAEQQRLRVALHEGEVEVRRGQLGRPIKLQAGQLLEADLSSWRVTPLSPRAPDAARPPPAPSAATSVAPTPSAPPPTPAPAWAALMRQSEFAAIVEQAEAMGVDRCFSSCSPGNLRILADAARYTGRSGLAEQSLLALRRRSPAQAAAATFFLGRLYESSGRGGDALRMYGQYLARAPGGDYAEQATAGRLRLLAGSRNTKAARAAAETYLRKFPGGAHAPMARRVLQGGATP